MNFARATDKAGPEHSLFAIELALIGKIFE